MKNDNDILQDELEKTTKTGFKDIDSLTGGFGTELIILASRPSMGKTMLAANLALSIAKEKGVLFLTLDMTKEQITQLCICALTAIDLHKLKLGYLYDTEKQSINIAKDNLKQSNLAIVESDGGLSNVLSTIELFNTPELGLIIIDNFTFLKDDSLDAEQKRYEEISNICLELKKMIKKIQVPILLLSSVKQDCDFRSDKRPVPIDLPVSIQTIADKIFFLYRESVYDERCDENRAELLVGKNKTGPIAKIRLFCSLKTCVFGGWEPNRSENVPAMKSKHRIRFGGGRQN